ncbi:MAG: hypothetical protein AAFN09_04220 [Pseudomonadota bacterium]
MRHLAALAQHYTLMLAVDFRPHRRWEKFGLVVSVPFHAAILVVLVVNVSGAFASGEIGAAWWPLVAFGIVAYAELTLIFVLQACATWSPRIRRRLYAQMMALRKGSDRIQLSAQTVHRLLAPHWSLALGQTAFLGLIVMGLAVMGLLSRWGLLT